MGFTDRIQVVGAAILRRFRVRVVYVDLDWLDCSRRLLDYTTIYHLGLLAFCLECRGNYR